MVKNESIRKRLEKRLLKDRSELLWSYDKERIKSLSDKLIVSKFLTFGNQNDWNDLKEAFDISYIKEVWEKDLLLGGLQIEKQKDLASFFFNSKNPARYISNNRRKKIRQIIEGHY